MRSLFLQIAAVTAINIRSIPQRFWLSLSTVVAVALVVMVLLSFLAMANGFQRTLKSTGAEDIAIALRGGSQSEINSVITREQARLIEDGPGIARGADGKPLVSAELYIVVDGIKRSTQTPLPVRGLGGGRPPPFARTSSSSRGVCSIPAPTRSWSARVCRANSRASTSGLR
jgi:putative ABC transport system permease protein